MPTLQTQIREWLVRYLAGELSLREFRRWFGPATWNVHLRADPATVELAYGIDLHLSEYTSGHWSEDELRHLLRPFLESYAGAPG